MNARLVVRMVDQTFNVQQPHPLLKRRERRARRQRRSERLGAGIAETVPPQASKRPALTRTVHRTATRQRERIHEPRSVPASPPLTQAS